MLIQLVDLIYNKNDSLDNEMNNIQTILSARQIAKFILWIDNNPICMQMLESLWPHITLSSSSSIQSRNNSVENLELLAQQHYKGGEIINSSSSSSSSSSSFIGGVTRKVNQEEYTEDDDEDDEDDEDDDDDD